MRNLLLATIATMVAALIVLTLVVVQDHVDAKKWRAYQSYCPPNPSECG